MRSPFPYPRTCYCLDWEHNPKERGPFEFVSMMMMSVMLRDSLPIRFDVWVMYSVVVVVVV